MNRPHTVIAVDEADIIAAIAGMISTLGTRHGYNCLKFDEEGPNRFTSVWRLTDRTSGFGISFRKGQDDPDRAYYRTAWDAAPAIHERNHTPAALLTKDGSRAATGNVCAVGEFPVRSWNGGAAT